MHKIKAVAQPIAEILKISYRGTLWACLATPLKIFANNLHQSWNLMHTEKIKTIAEVIAEILKFGYFGTLWACLRKPDNAYNHA